MKRSFFQAAVVSILLYGCTTWTLTKRLEEKLDSNYTRMLRAILNKSWRQHPKRHQLYGHLPPVTKTIQVRRTRHAGHCWRSKDVRISDVLLWTPAYCRAKAWFFIFFHKILTVWFILSVLTGINCVASVFLKILFAQFKEIQIYWFVDQFFIQSFKLSSGIYIYIYMYIYKLLLSTVVDGDHKAPFSISSTPRCRRWFYFFSLDYLHYLTK